MAATERWLPVVGHGQDLYEVSDKGNVRRVGGNVMKKSVLSNGYEKVGLCAGGKYRVAYVHHLVLESFVGVRVKGQVTRHLDGHKTNNALSNLRWGTRQENAVDAAKHGDVSRRSRHYNAKLTEEIVAEARTSYRAGEASMRSRVRRYMEDAINGKKWRHVHV